MILIIKAQLFIKLVASLMPPEFGKLKDNGMCPHGMFKDSCEACKNEAIGEKEKIKESSATNHCLREVVDDEKLAERMAYAVDSLREVSMKLYNEAKRDLEKLGFESEVQNLPDSLVNGDSPFGDTKFAALLMNSFDYEKISIDKYDDLAKIKTKLSESIYYETMAKHREYRIALAVEALKVKAAPSEDYWKKLIAQSIIGAYVDGYSAKIKDNKIGKMAVKGFEAMGGAFNKAQDAAAGIKDASIELMSDIKWKIKGL